MKSILFCLILFVSLYSTAEPEKNYHVSIKQGNVLKLYSQQITFFDSILKEYITLQPHSFYFNLRVHDSLKFNVRIYRMTANIKYLNESGEEAVANYEFFNKQQADKHIWIKRHTSITTRAITAEGLPTAIDGQYEVMLHIETILYEGDRLVEEIGFSHKVKVQPGVVQVPSIIW